MVLCATISATKSATSRATSSKEADLDDNASFGYWLQRRRKALDLTQADLARRVGCSLGTIRMIEADARRPSRQMAELLAEQLDIPPGERAAFVKAARAELAVHRLAAPTPPTAFPPRRTFETTPHNLPLQLTSFVGREKEMAEVKRLVAGTDLTGFQNLSGLPRLVTLTGSGGCGKTRLALKAAADLMDWFPDGVWLVELAPLASLALVPQAIAVTLGVKEEAGRPLVDTLTNYLRGKNTLLLLDNCEHLVEAVAQLVEGLLHACPNLHILASSREILGVSGERSFYVPSLSTPEPQAVPDVETLLRYEAVRLFVERAAAVAPPFVLTRDNSPAVAEVCQRLDGIPLAIELAAARVKMLRVEQIAARLEDRFQLLTGGSRTALPRHQTLAASIEWSYDLLSESERTLLRRLSVFAGGSTLEGAERVCADDLTPGPVSDRPTGRGESAPPSLKGKGEGGLGPMTVLDLLTQLVNKSLVVAERRQGAETRYRMLETIRQYTLAKLAASGEADAVRREHAMYYLALAEAGELSRPIQPAWLDRMETEHDNLRAALTWSQSGVGSAELGLLLAFPVAEAWLQHGYVTEARDWLEGALARADVEGVDYPQARAKVLWDLGEVLAYQGHYAAGQAHMAHSLRLFRDLGDLPLSAAVLQGLGWLAREHGDTTAARARLEESLALSREIGDKLGIAGSLVTLGEVAVMQEDTAWATALLEESLALFQEHQVHYGIGWVFNHLGHVAQLQGEYERATRLHEESLPVFREYGAQNIGVAWALQGLGETALAQGDAPLAATHLMEALALFRDPGDRAGMAWCLAGLAGAAALDEEPERAAWLWGAAEALRQSIGAREAPASRATRERLIAQAREQLGDAAFAAARAEGQAASPERAIAQALRSSE